MTFRSIAFLAISALLAASSARAETACTEDIVRARLAKMLEEFQKPEIRARLDAAKKDLDEDGDIDNEDDAQYLALVAAWHDIDRNLKGSVESACEVMMRHDAQIKAILGV